MRLCCKCKCAGRCRNADTGEVISTAGANIALIACLEVVFPTLLLSAARLLGCRGDDDFLAFDVRGSRLCCGGACVGGCVPLSCHFLFGIAISSLR